MGGCTLKFFITLIAVAISLTSGLAADWFVDDDAAAGGDGTSPGTAFQTILQAVNAAANAPGADTITVADGNYTGPAVNVSFQGNSTHIKSENGPGSCTIDGGSLHSGFQFNSPGETGSIVDGFTFTNMVGFGGGGSAINIENVTIQVRNCRFVNNSSIAALTGGGAVSLVNSGTKFVNCQFTGNSILLGSGNGGAVFSGGGSFPTFQTCSFTSNSAVNGGAVWTDSAVMENCTVNGNSAVDGGGFYLSGGSLFMRTMAFAGNHTSGTGGAIYSTNSVITGINCTFAGNTSIGAGASLRILSCLGSVFKNSIFWGNGGGSGISGNLSGELSFEYSHVQLYSFEGGAPPNSNADPMLTNLPGIFGSNDFGDLRLQAGSPCIDTGSDTLYQDSFFYIALDLDGNIRPMGSSVDRGAYEKVDAVFLISQIKNRIDVIVQTTTLPADGHPLKQKLNQAAAAIIAGDNPKAILRLNEFIAKVNEMVSPKKLTAAQAAELVGMAQEIIALLQP